jgi:hypothetical protein
MYEKEKKNWKKGHEEKALNNHGKKIKNLGGNFTF